MERVRFRQGLRSNPQGLALTGSHARLCFDSFGGKTGGVWIVGRSLLASRLWQLGFASVQKLPHNP